MKKIKTKIKSVAVAKTPTKYKLEVDKILIDKIISFMYLGADISSIRNLISGVQNKYMRYINTKTC